MGPTPASDRRATGLFVLLLAGYWVAQAIVAVVFKYGALLGAAQPQYWVACFAAGNAIGISSAVLWMAALKRGSGNVATGLAVGGTFLAQQIALVLVYRGSLTLVQDVGIAVIVGGMLCLGCGARRQTEPTSMQPDPARQPDSQVTET